MLGKKIKQSGCKVWLINTGMTGGAYGTGKRMSLKHTRRLISEGLSGKLDNQSFETDPVFGVEIPTFCDGVPSKILNPRNTWHSKSEYDHKAQELAFAFIENFAKFRDAASREMLEASPRVAIEA